MKYLLPAVFRWLPLAYLLCILGTVPVLADSPNRTIFQLQHTGWTAREGAPSPITSLAQTKDGYLWLGTPTGLFRFDGVHFERYQLPSGERFRSDNIASLMATTDGGLWVGFRYGNASFLKDGRIVDYGEPEGLPPGTVFEFAIDWDGAVWAAANGGLARFTGSRWQRIGEGWAYPGKSAKALFVDREGTLWAGTEDTVVFLPRGQKLFRKTGERDGLITQIAQAPNGQIWLSDSTKSIVRPIAAWGTKLRQPSPGINESAFAILFDRTSLWVATNGNGTRRISTLEQAQNHRIVQLSHLMEIFTRRDGATADSQHEFLQDREGNIWVGTDRGLDRFRASDIIPVPLPTGGGVDNTPALVAGERGVAWVAGQKNRNDVYLIDHRGSLTTVHGVEAGGIRCAYRDAGGDIWLGGVGGGLWRIDRRYTVRKIPLPKEEGRFAIQAITQDHSGGIWVSIVRSGVFFRANGVWMRFGNRPELPKLTAITLSTDSAGRVWFGYMGSMIALLDGNAVRTFGPQEGMRVVNVQVIQEHAGHVWVGGERGLAIFQGSRFQSVTADGVALEGISGIVETNTGDLWLNAAPGIIHIPAVEVRRALENPDWHTHCELFDFRDGFIGRAPQLGPIPSAGTSSDGRLWFTTMDGAAQLDPQHLSRNPVPPPVYVQTLSPNGGAYSTLGESKLPLGTTGIHIEYTALNFSVPERVRFRYRLEGVDSDWQNAGTRREAFYTNLPPGKYHFQVIACNNDGVWNKEGASLDFSIPAAWYQTRWLSFLSVFCGLLLAWFLYRFRLNRMAASMNARFDERLDERARMARELHDAFLQTVQGSKLVADHALRRSSDPAQMHRALEQLSEWLAQAIQEGRAALTSLRTSTTPRDDLADALQRATENGFLPDSMAVTFSVIGDSRDMHPIVRDEVYRIAYEAIRNSCLHSAATQMEIQLRYSQDLTLRISDNGTGFDPALADKGKDEHFGLQGMRERAARIGAKFTLLTSASGTEIKLIVPGGTIFRTSGRPRQRLLAKIRDLFRLKCKEFNLD